MKRIIYLAYMLPMVSFSQLMTEATDPAIGSTSNLYLCDSNATKYENVIGNGVTWDYSSILGVDTDNDGIPEIRSLSTSAIDPNSSDSLFPGATKKFSINNQIITYYSTTPTERISQGFKFTEPSLGDVFNYWDTTVQQLNTYPFDLGSISNAPMSGRIYSYNATVSIDTFAYGNAFSTIDGIGTLKLGSVDYPNTFRYHFKDTINSYVTINILGISSPVVLYRDVYEYYNAVSPLPIFVIYTVDNSIIAQPNTIVLSRELPDQNVGISEVNNELSIYPNPSSGVFKINMPLNGKGIVMDQLGKQLMQVESDTIDLTKFDNGVYYLTIDKLNKTVKLIKN